MTRLLSKPVSVRSATSIIVSATGLVVVIGGVLVRFVDHDHFPNVWLGMWWALQTATTVGYGDVVPENVTGRIVGAVLMLQGLAFLAIVTAAITSTFVARAQRELAKGEDVEDEQAARHVDDRFDDQAARLDRLEALLARDADA
jgi:voltage-gated potassium channel